MIIILLDNVTSSIKLQHQDFKKQFINSEQSLIGLRKLFKIRIQLLLSMLFVSLLRQFTGTHWL